MQLSYNNAQPDSYASLGSNLPRCYAWPQLTTQRFFTMH